MDETGVGAVELSADIGADEVHLARSSGADQINAGAYLDAVAIQRAPAGAFEGAVGAVEAAAGTVIVDGVVVLVLGLEPDPFAALAMP